MEHLLHYTWKHRLFPLAGLQTTAGQTVEIIDPGLHNSKDAGPDFFNAKLKIGGTLWVGNVEIHQRSSDWVRHGHHQDKAYDSVILHVVREADTEVYRSNGKPIPQLVLPCPPHVQEHYKALCRQDDRPACHRVLASLPVLKIHAWLTALQSERFEQKSTAIRQRLERCNHNWEDAFFITLARYYGFGLNGDAFEAWACTLPFRAIDKHRDSLFQIEAFFFGQAGLLEERKPEAGEYYEKLRQEHHYLQHKFAFAPGIDASRWKMLRLRPGNFPYVRIAQLACLYHHAQGLFSHILEAETPEAACRTLQTRTSEYWRKHYYFGKESSEQEKNIGITSLNILVINVVIPFLYTYGLYKGNPALCDRATRFLESLKPENNHIIRHWAQAGIRAESAADSQALIQLQKEYCDKRKCLFCRFGYEYLRMK